MWHKLIPEDLLPHGWCCMTCLGVASISGNTDQHADEYFLIDSRSGLFESSLNSIIG